MAKCLSPQSSSRSSSVRDGNVERFEAPVFPRQRHQLQTRLDADLVQTPFKALNRWFYRTFLEHPAENRFTAKEFVAVLERCGISVGSNQLEWFLGDFIVGVGRRLHQQSEGEPDHAESNQET